MMKQWCIPESAEDFEFGGSRQCPLDPPPRPARLELALVVGALRFDLASSRFKSKFKVFGRLWYFAIWFCLASLESAIETEVEYLYLKPYADDLDFAVKSPGGVIFNPGNVDGTCKYEFIPLKWDSGVRASVLAEIYCGFSLIASYTYYQTSDEQDVSVNPPNQIFATFAEMENISSAFGKWDLNFQSADLLASYDFCGFRPALGVTWLSFDQKLKAGYFSEAENAFFDWHSKYNAVGLKAGGDYNFALADNIDLYAKAYVSLLVGDSDDKNRTDSLGFKSHDRLFVPNWHLGIGIQYHECYRNITLGIRLGYEIMAWHGIPTPARFTEEGVRVGTGSARANATFGLQGVTAGLAVGF